MARLKKAKSAAATKPIRPLRNEADYEWFSVAENTYDNFMIRKMRG